MSFFCISCLDGWLELLVCFWEKGEEEEEEEEEEEAAMAKSDLTVGEEEKWQERERAKIFVGEKKRESWNKNAWTRKKRSFCAR